MPITISGIVVASSRKWGGICLVIFETKKKQFYRIVSSDENRQDKELKKYECTYEDGTSVANLDVIEVGVKSLECINDIYQPENIYYDEYSKIKKIGKATKNQLLTLYGENKLNTSREIFINNRGSMSPAEAILSKNSFMLVRVYGLEFYESVNRNGEKNCKCRFKYNYTDYEDISVTISQTKEEDIRKYASKNRRYPNAIVCFSFGHDYEGKCFKFLCSFLGYSSFKGDK